MNKKRLIIILGCVAALLVAGALSSTLENNTNVGNRAELKIISGGGY
jgi:hypothetical protein